MAKYDITYSCGHTATVELWGKESDRQRKIEYYQSCGICPDCSAKKTEAAYEAVSQQYNLPTLTGTDKQIAYAKRLVAKFATADPKSMEKAETAIERLHDAENLANMAAAGLVPEEVLKNLLVARPRFKAAYTILTESASGKLIDILAY